MTTIGELPLVFIPAAGLGSRVVNLGVSKPLISLGQLPLICRVILSYPKSTRFIVALGYKSEYLEQVLNEFRSEYDVHLEYTYTDSYKTETIGGLGLTQTLIDSRHRLLQPFIFHSVDTILTGDDWLNHLADPLNQVLVAPLSQPGLYRVPTSTGLVHKTCQPKTLAYIGVARIQNFESFWETFDLRYSASESGEGESLGIELEKFRVTSLESTSWKDMGNPLEVQNYLADHKNPDKVLNKPDEAIWVFGKRMVKFHVSAEFISGRLKRAKALQGFVPECQSPYPNILTYDRAFGQVLSDCTEDACFRKFLDFSLSFWKGKSGVEDTSGNYWDFYFVKTGQRVETYLKTHPEDASITSVNGTPLPGVLQLLTTLDWNTLSQPNLVRAHGDYHTENVIHNHGTGSFTLVDWRQSLADSSSAYGDLYYDLAKLLHGLLVDHGTVQKGAFSVSNDDSSGSTIKIEIPVNKLSWLSIFSFFIEDQGYDVQKIWILTGLIFLNIAPLHHEGYDKFLFRLGLLILGTDDFSKLTGQITGKLVK
jgi:hypothetical protein